MPDALATLLAPVQFLNDSYKAHIEKVWKFAVRAYGKKRVHGIALIDHAYETARIIAELDLGKNALTAALLNKVLIHTKVSEEMIQNEFGELTLARLKALKTVSLARYKDSQIHAESMLTFFIAASEDLRVLIIKIAELGKSGIFHVCGRFQSGSSARHLEDQGRYFRFGGELPA